MNKGQVISLLESRMVENDAAYFAQYICEALEDSGYEVTNEIFDIIGDSYFNINESSSDEDVADNIVEHLEANGYKVDEGGKGLISRIIGAAKGAWRGAKMAWKGSSEEGRQAKNDRAKISRVKKSNKRNAIDAWASIGRPGTAKGTGSGSTSNSTSGSHNESTKYPNLHKLLEYSAADIASGYCKRKKNQ